MKKSATVRAYEGKVVVPSKNNPEYGSIRLEQTVATTQNGFIQTQKRSAFLNGKIEDLKALGWVDGQSIPGHIVIKEQLEPFNTENPDMDLKIAGDTKVPCTKEGQPIYRRAFFSFSEEPDTVIAHDNSEEIKAAQAKMEEAQSLDQG